jgi:uncharacterized protein YceH (UPF0502 family)
MTAEATPTPSSPPPAPNWPQMNLVERRVLGVLVEKQKTTPDAYPMSVNSLVTGCNQKTNRDPILNLDDVQVEEALASLQKRGLVVKLTGGRVEKWRHVAYEAWKADKAEMAVLCELLVRDPQTEGELRTRVARMEPMEDLDALRKVLKPLADRKLVVYLTPEGRRGTSLTNGFHTPAELDRMRASLPLEPIASVAAPPVPAPAPAPPPEFLAELAEARAEIGRLRNDLAALQQRVTTLAEQVQQLKDGLGVS